NSNTAIPNGKNLYKRLIYILLPFKSNIVTSCKNNSNGNDKYHQVSDNVFFQPETVSLFICSKKPNYDSGDNYDTVPVDSKRTVMKKTPIALRGTISQKNDSFSMCITNFWESFLSCNKILPFFSAVFINFLKQ